MTMEQVEQIEELRAKAKVLSAERDGYTTCINVGGKDDGAYCFRIDANTGEFLVALVNAWPQLKAAALSHLRSQPAGYVSVPREPTAEIIWAMEDRQTEGASRLGLNSIQYSLWVEVYKAGLAAASPPAGEGAMTGISDLLKTTLSTLTNQTDRANAREAALRELVRLRRENAAATKGEDKHGLHWVDVFAYQRHCENEWKAWQVAIKLSDALQTITDVAEE